MERKTKSSFSQITTKIIHAKTNFRKRGRLGNKAKKNKTKQQQQQQQQQQNIEISKIL